MEEETYIGNQRAEEVDQIIEMGGSREGLVEGGKVRDQRLGIKEMFGHDLPMGVEIEESGDHIYETIFNGGQI